MTETKKKECVICGAEFIPRSSFMTWCSGECGYEVHKQKEAKKAEKKKKAIRKEIAEFRKANKPKAKLMAEAQASVNAYVRVRDFRKPCISCGSASGGDNYLTGSRWDAGHYRSRGSAGHLRFNLHNIHKQCVRCNRELSGNHVEYRKRLVALKGEEFVLNLEYDNGRLDITPEYCERIKKIFNKKTRMKKKRLGLI